MTYENEFENTNGGVAPENSDVNVNNNPTPITENNDTDILRVHSTEEPKSAEYMQESAPETKNAFAENNFDSMQTVNNTEPSAQSDSAAFFNYGQSERQPEQPFYGTKKETEEISGQPTQSFAQPESPYKAQDSYSERSQQPSAASDSYSSQPDYSAARGEKTFVGANNREAQNGSYENNVQNQGGYGIGAGIRYDSDKRSEDGAYTWKYTDTTNSGSTQNNATNKKKSGHKAFFAAALAFLFIGTAVVSSVLTANFVRNSFVSSDADGTQTSDKPHIGQKNNGAENLVTIPDPSNGGVLTKQQIAKKCKPSSVGIEVITTTTGFYGYSYKSGGVGSGFILTEDGYIATNHHVIDGADSITVQLDDGTKYEATLVGSDAITDLAVIKIEASGLVPMEIGDSDKMVVGDSVIAIGTPAGIEFAGTVTDGIISAINRGVEITNDRGTVVKTMTLMQTNAAINPGNSGGPLINDKGEVIGINTMKLTSTYEGIGFSIPINSAVTIFNQLISDGKVSEYDNNFVTGNGAIGITNYVEISEEESEYYGVPAGIVVIQLDRNSGAFDAGLKRGDTIIGFQGSEVKTVAELNRLKSKYKAGDEVTIRIYRDGEGELDITFKLDLMQS